MKTVSAGLQTHLASEVATLATCWLITRAVDGLVLGFTDHDDDIVFNGITYSAATGYTPADVSTTSALNVDNTELHGILTSPAITEDDLRAGLWDLATVQIFVVNWKDLTQGQMYQRVGTLGEVTVERGTFRAELRGLTQAYATSIGELTSAACRAVFGDARCGVSLGGVAVTGTLTGVSADGATLYDTARAEAGPTGGIAITGVSNTNPGKVTVATAMTVPNGSAVTIAGVIGMAAINTVTVVRNLNAALTTFDLAVDTTDTTVWGVYGSGGTVVPLGSDSGYFDGGVITFTSGLNSGRSMEVKSYVPGQMTLQMPMPYAVAVGDTYSMRAGCDHSMATCRDRYSNLVNFRGEPYVPGIDKMIQVARSQ